MKHVRKRLQVGAKQIPIGTLCGAPITIHDVSMRAFQTQVGVERLGSGMCPECVRIRLDIARPQVSQRVTKRAEREGRV